MFSSAEKKNPTGQISKRIAKWVEILVTRWLITLDTDINKKLTKLTRLIVVAGIGVNLVG
jgi:hypothetical protein